MPGSNPGSRTMSTSLKLSVLLLNPQRNGNNNYITQRIAVRHEFIHITQLEQDLANSKRAFLVIFSTLAITVPITIITATKSALSPL